MIQVEAAVFHADLYAKKAHLYRPRIREIIEVGSLIRGDFYLRVLRIRTRLQQQMALILASPAPLNGLPAPATPRRRGSGG